MISQCAARSVLHDPGIDPLPFPRSDPSGRGAALYRRFGLVLMVTHAIQLAPHASRVIEMVGGGICTEKAVSSSVLKGS